MLRLTSGFIKLLILIGPIVLLTVLGANYLVGVFYTLESPGVPVELKFESATGKAGRISAASYSIDLQGGIARVDGLRFDGGENATIASADTVVLTGLNLFFGGDQVVKARVTNLKGRLVRLENGQLELQDYLPKSDNQPSEQPFTAEIDDIDLEVVDRAGNRWAETVKSRQILIAGAGDNWIAHGRGTISNVGELDIRLQNVRDLGLSIVGSTPETQLAKLANHLTTTPEAKGYPELKTASVASATIQGPFRLFLPAKRDLQFESSLVAKVDGVRYGEYRVDAATFQGRLTEVGATGEFGARLGPNRATGKASFRWDKQQRAAGYVSVSSPSRGDLPNWIQNLVPKDANYHEVGFNGYVAYYPQNGPSLTGQVKARDAVFQGQSLSGINARIRYEKDDLLVKLDQGLFQGQHTGGLVALNTKTQTVQGSLKTIRVDLAEASKLFKVTGLKGYALVSATLTGTTKSPVVAFNASGAGSYAYQNQKFEAPAFQVSGTYAKNAVEIKRALIDSPAALITAKGSIGMNGSVGIDVVARGVKPKQIDERLGGTANLVARVTGTLSDPQVKGQLEGYALQYRDELLPVAKAQFTADKSEARFTDFEAVRGSAVIEGSGKFTYASKAIQGDFDAAGIQITEFLGDDFAGALQVPALELAGTLDQPIVTGQVRGNNLIARGVKISLFNARIQTEGDTFRLVDTFANAAGGTITANGGYNVKQKSGQFTLTASNLDIEQLMPEFTGYASADGQVSGEATVQLVNNQLREASGSGDLTDIVVNNTKLGNGSWDLSTAGTTVNANFQLGQLDRFITLDNLTYNTETKQIGGDIAAFNQQLPDLVALSKRYLPKTLSYESLRTLSSIQGNLSLSAALKGTVEEPEVEIPVLEAKDIKVRDARFASLTADVSRKGTKWTIDKLTLLGDDKLVTGVGRRGQAHYDVTGTVDEEGQMDLDGAFTNIGVSEFSAFVPWFTGKTGEADVFFTATGPTDSPDVRASISANGLLGELDPVLMANLAVAEAKAPLTPEQRQEFYGKTLSIDIPEINLSNGSGDNAGIRVAGNYTFRGFQGTLSADAPFQYPFKIPTNQPTDARITLDASTLNDIATYVDTLDPNRTKGSLTGSLVASGTLDNLDLKGDIRLAASSFALDSMSDAVKNLVTEVSLRNDKLAITATGESTRGGDLMAEAAMPISNLGNFAQALSSGLTDTLFKNPVTGSAKITDLAFQQTIADGRVAAVVGGDITLGGTIQNPAIAGTVNLSKVDAQIPGFEAADAKSTEPSVNPSFNLKVALTDPARIRSSAADLYLLGDGTINGTLIRPNVQAGLYVDKGNLNLPGARIRIEQGGTVEMRYAKTRLDTEASVNVDLEGRTSVSASSYTSQVERYEIFLGIRGDLLTEGGLTLSATSDPPDLSQDRILALIGQTDLISNIGAGLAGGGIGADTQKQLQNALIGYALPGLLDPVTAGISRSLGLDYLNLEYDAYQQATFVFSKPLGGGFSLQGRRQVTAPPPGFPQQFEIKLIYRPRRLPSILNRFTFSVGADETRPWKVAIEYGTRF